MSDSAKNSTKLHDTDPISRSELVILARRHFRNGGTAAEFERDYGVPRGTVAGWHKGNDGPPGRPFKLPSINEMEILKSLSKSQKPHNWVAVQDLVRKQSGLRMSRRSIFRLLKKWRLSPESTPPKDSPAITANEWIQPAEIVDKGDEALPLIIWRLSNARGMDFFMLTKDDSADVLAYVAQTVAVRQRSRKRQLQTNQRELASELRNLLPDWTVTEVTTIGKSSFG